MTPNIKLKRSAVAGRVPSVDQLELGEVAINTADGKMYIKRDVGGTETIVLVNDAQEGIWKQYSYTATAAQTTFSGSDANSQVLAYSVGYAEVYLNGILLDPAVDYTANTGYSIELTVAAEADDVLQIDSFSSTIGPGDIVTNTFTGDNSTVSFTLTTDPGVEDNVFVYIDGVYQEKETYSVNGSSLVFSEAPYTDASIEALIGSRNITLEDINDLSITGDFSALGTISGNIFSGTSATLTGQMSSGSVSTSAITATTIDTTDDITTTTDVNANNINATGSVSVTGDVEASTMTLGDAVLAWNDIEGTVDIAYDGATLQVGQEQHFYAKASGAIANGDVVMFAGAQGDHLLVAKADHDSVGFKPEFIVGLATQDILNNEFGYVTSFGKVRELDTSSYSEGDILYFDPSVTGGLTTTRPSAPDHIIQMAAVLRSHATEGTLLVRPQHFSDTDEIEEGSTNLYYTDDRVSGLVNTAFIANLVDATNIDYDNTVSGISANTVQEAIDYLNTLSGGGNQGDVASYTREKFTATADQTTFTLADGYTLGYLEVFLNGVLLDTSDYTANDESTVVLGVGAKAGDELITIALDSFAIAELLRVTSISASAPDDCLNVTADGTLRIALSDETPLYGRGNTGNLDLLNTNTGNTEGGWLSFSGNMGNPTPSYQMAAITAGKDSAEGDNNYAGHLSLWTTSGGANGEANSGQYERMRIDGLGRVGIGVSNPLTRLQVEESTGETIPFRFGNSSGANTYLSLYNSGSVNPWDAKIGTTGTDLRLATSNTDRIIIDSNGNVLINTTTNYPSFRNSKLVVEATGIDIGATIVSDGDSNTQTMNLIRHSGHGLYMECRQGADSGLQSGLIGSRSGEFYVGHSNTGAGFRSDINSMLPINPSTPGSLSDASMSLGWTNQRFKDLYLSGGVHLGGTGSDHKLDYYEEGTWTPVPNSGTFSPIAFARYTRIGDTVHFWMEVTLAGTRSAGVFEIAGLPFVADYYQACTGYAKVYTDEGIQEFAPFVYNNTTNIRINSFGTDIAGTKLGNGYLNISGTYRTSD